MQCSTKHTLKIIYLPFFITTFFSYLLLFPGIAVSISDANSRCEGHLVLSTMTDPKTFNPIVAQETSSTQILDFVFEGLTQTDPETGDVLPHLAETWLRDETGLTWTFRLRRDVYWSDGMPFTAHDVLFTFKKLIYNPTVITGYKSIFTIQGKPIKVVAVDDFTVQFILPSRFAPFLRSLTAAILPRHALIQSVTDNTFNEAWGIREQPGTIVGTGPFTIDEYIPGEKVVLKKNPYYWKRDVAGIRLPYLDTIYFLIVQSQDIALLKFKNQEIDVYGLRGIDYPWLKPLESEGLFTIYNLGPTMSRYFLACNQNTAVSPQTKQPYVDPVKLQWFTNKNFRQALMHCINKEAIIELVFNGLAIPQNSVMSPASGFFYNDDVPQYDFDVTKARELLAADNIMDRDHDGILEDATGNPITFNLYISSGNIQATHLANLIRKDLARAGFNVNLIHLEFNTLVNKLSFTFDWDMVFMGLTGGVEPHFGANVWFSHGPLHLWYPRQVTPATEWEQRIDELFQAGVEELDRVERKKFYDEWQAIVADELPLLYTVIPQRITAVNNRLANIKPTVLGGILHNIEEIYIRDHRPQTTDHSKETKTSQKLAVDSSRGL